MDLQVPGNASIFLMQHCLQVPKPLHMLDIVRNRGLLSEEQFEQKLIALYRIFNWFREPVMQFFSTSIRERVYIALRLPLLLFSMTGCKPFFGKLFQYRIDLPVTLIPKIGNALLNLLLDCITRHWTRAKHSQNGIPAFIFFCHQRDSLDIS